MTSDRRTTYALTHKIPDRLGWHRTGIKLQSNISALIIQRQLSLMDAAKLRHDDTLPPELHRNRLLPLDNIQ